MDYEQCFKQREKTLHASCQALTFLVLYILKHFSTGFYFDLRFWLNNDRYTIYVCTYKRTNGPNVVMLCTLYQNPENTMKWLHLILIQLQMPTMTLRVIRLLELAILYELISDHINYILFMYLIDRCIPLKKKKKVTLNIKHHTLYIQCNNFMYWGLVTAEESRVTGMGPRFGLCQWDNGLTMFVQ